MPNRRHLLTLAPLAALAALAGCAAPPPALPPTPSAAERRQQRLEQLGFRRQADDWSLDLAARITFDSASAELSREAVAEVERLAVVLREVGIDRCRVEGHADDVGRDDFNDRLSLRRAEAVLRALVAAGMPEANLSARGLGKSRPVGDNRTEAGRAQNRRVVIIVPGG